MDNENPLVQLNESAGGALVQQDDTKALAALGGGKNFLPYIQLFTSRNDKVTSGEIPMNSWGLVEGENTTVLGTDIDIMPVAWRPMAMDTSDENAVVVFDPQLDDDGKPTGIFAQIQDKADEPGMNGAMYGPQYLVWVPEVRKFATWWLNSKTARNLSQTVHTRLKMGATIGSRLIDNGKYKWQAPTIKPCSTPFDMPDQDELQRVYDDFINPPAPKVEVAEEDERER